MGRYEEQGEELDEVLSIPDGEICLQEMEGSGFPVAKQASVMLLPSFTTMSFEI